MESEQLLGLGLAVLVASITPGPNNIILATVGSMHGIRQGFPLVAGVVLGFASMMLLSVLGIGSLLVLYADYIWWIDYVGVAFLCWLSWKIATAPIGDKAMGDKVGEKGLMLLIGRGFWGMLGFQFINPKSIVVALALTSSFVDYQSGDILQQSLWMLIISFCCSFISASTWLIIGNLLGNILREQGWECRFNVGMALLLLGSMLPVFYGLD